ncbi:hypothetical protein [Novosphingobium aromaticivorans]|uniref:hypothetical protein n=1 Tax=Novosphingobium aromaticivorans TaxID=48935 RepID=UPI00003C7CA4|nr:hypothetical protein [Novosphingobium aromaticivorans]
MPGPVGGTAEAVRVGVGAAGVGVATGVPLVIAVGVGGEGSLLQAASGNAASAAARRQGRIMPH